MTKARTLANLGAVTSSATELNYVDNVTSAVQTQLDAKLPLAGGTMTGDLVPATPLSHRNMIINGGMNVYQRGSLAITQSNDGGYALDRFSYYQTGTVGQWQGTMSQHPMSDPDVITTGHTTGLKILTTAHETSIGSDEYGTIVYKVEAQDCQRMCAGRTNAKAVTLSFWAKSKVAGDYAISMYQQDGDEIIGSKYTLVADTWTKVEITFAGNTSANINDDNGLGLMFKWILFAGGDWTSSSNTSWSASANAKIGYGHTADWGETANDDFYLTGVQLELGSNATPFEHRSFGEELQRCDRYYQKSFQYATVPAHGIEGLYGSTTPYHTAICKLICHLSNPMRAIPDFTFYSSNSGASGSQVNSHDGSWANTNATASGLSNRAFNLDFNHTGANTDETVLVNFGYEAVAEL